MRLRHRWHDGHHFGIICCALTAGTVLSINVILTVVVAAKLETSGGIGVFQDGDCDQTKRLDTWFHLLINVLSTLLLGASNYSMQCLCAPTRQDIDKAHRQKVWMDIGVPSVRNVFRISWLRKLLWFLLFISSVPVHLMYNSAIFSSKSIVSEWTAFAVTSDFLTGAPFNASREDAQYSSDHVTNRLEWLLHSKSLIRLENEACINAYNNSGLLTAWADVLFISTHASSNNSLIWSNTTFNTQVANNGKAAFCEVEPPGHDRATCINNGSPDPNNWTLYSMSSSDAQISHCMANKAQEHCKMQFSMPLMVAVIGCNLIKVICIGIVIWKLDPRPLVTIGDAIASFLDSPDATTARNCLGNKKAFKKSSKWTEMPSQYSPRRHKWFTSASLTRWLVTTILCALSLTAAFSLLIIGLVKSEPSTIIGNNRIGNSPLLGFEGTPAFIVAESLEGNFVASILVANSPQLLLSFLYFAYNGLWTCMLLAQEWSDYATKRKFLRVTSPSGRQRSTYRLQLPYRYGIPLLIISGTFHWLVSQSVFLVILDYYNYDGTPNTSPGDDLSLIFCNPLAILVVIFTGSIVLVLGIANGFRRYPRSGIPLSGSCSAAISAACHPPPGDVQASTKAVMWGACGSEVDGDWDGVTNMGSTAFNVWKESLRQREASGEGVKVGHCSFTSFTVEEPTLGKFYAGLRNRNS